MVMRTSTGSPAAQLLYNVNYCRPWGEFLTGVTKSSFRECWDCPPTITGNTRGILCFTRRRQRSQNYDFARGDTEMNSDYY